MTHELSVQQKSRLKNGSVAIEIFHLRTLLSRITITEDRECGGWLPRLQSHGKLNLQLHVDTSHSITNSVVSPSSTAVSPSVGGVLQSTSTSAPPVPLRSYDTSESLLNTENPSSMYPSRFGNTYGGIGNYGGLSSYSSPYSRFGGMGSGMYGGYGSSMYGGMGYGSYPGYNGMGGFGGYGMGDPNDPNNLSRRMEAGTQGMPVLNYKLKVSDVSDYREYRGCFWWIRTDA